MAVEIQEGLHYTMSCVMNAAKIVKYLSGQAVISQYTAVNVLKEKVAEIIADQIGEILVRAALITEVEIQEDLREATLVIAVLHSL